MTKILVRSLGVAVLLAVPALALGSANTAQATHSSSSEAMTLLEDGSKYYLQQQFAQAIGPYAKALELEKRQATLDRTMWRVLIDNLGMAYGISGDLKRAKDTFEYGLSKDKTYPMFYYNLACTYAEMNDLDGSLANLRLAFKYKANMIAGEQIPDPAKDDSFQRFMKNDRFVTAIRELSQPAP